ncbi:MAG: BrnA antitoxin family protein [Holosporales bacterium]
MGQCFSPINFGKEPYLLAPTFLHQKEWFKKARPARVVFAEHFGAEEADAMLAEAKRRRGQRGKQKAPTKKGVYLRLSPQVLEYFRAKGPGWQTRIDKTLAAIVEATG